MQMQAGTTLGGRYVLRSLLAVGGMGEVWRGIDSELDRPVAVKVLKEEAQGNETFLKRFRNEAKNAAGLMHPHIAQVFDYGDQAGTAYLIMELVEGEPLSTVLERELTVDEHRLVRMMIGTCQGLHAAHQAQVMHRDIKPGNLLIEGEDHVKITDFGVSRSHDQTTLTATGMVMGTAQYLAPELALGKPATPASDLYALGIIAYESVVGRRPFTASSPVDIAIAQVNEPVPPIPSAVSPVLAALIMDLLEKNPKRRPATALELEGLLSRLRLPTKTERAARERGAPQTIVPQRAGHAPAHPMPPSVAPARYRPRPDAPSNRHI
jgi:serine/threonine protein kinase